MNQLSFVAISCHVAPDTDATSWRTAASTASAEKDSTTSLPFPQYGRPAPSSYVR